MDARLIRMQFATLVAGLVLACMLAAVPAGALVQKAYAQEAGDALQATVLSASDTASAPNVAKHTKAEVVSYLASHGVSLSEGQTYAVNPVLNSQAGMLSNESKNAALTMLNNIRYIAGVDSVALRDEYGEMAQAGAFVDYAVGRLTHTPEADGLAKPDGMSDDLWNLGNDGTSSSNLAWGYRTLNAAVLGWMSDADASNIDRVGHRRWCINPTMGATGFGAAGTFYAMFAFDTSAAGGQSDVVWPAQAMPVEFFDDTDPWSISVGSAISDTSSVKVELTRNSDGKTWTFDTLSTSAPASMSDKYFGINNGYYGAPGCIIFRPENISYNIGDVFHVRASGVNGRTIEYDVEFFSGYPVKAISFAQDTIYSKYSGSSITPTTTPSDAQGYKVTWKSSNAKVVKVSADGVLTNVGPGTATVTATISGAYTASGGDISASVKVVVPQEINSNNFDISFSNLEYTGAPIQPKATIVSKSTGAKLVQGVDFEITMQRDIVNVGDTDVAWINGFGAYGASSSWGVFVEVQPRKITSSMASIATKTFTYNKKSHTQSVSLKYNGKQLAKGTDYDVTYKNNKNAGTATVVVTGKGNFQGSISKTFKIVKAANPMNVKAKKITLKYSKKQRTLKAAKAFKFSKKAAGKVTYTRVAKGSSKYLTVNKKTGNITVKKKAPKKTHSLKVKVRGAGNANYKAKTKTVTVKVVVR